MIMIIAISIFTAIGICTCVLLFFGAVGEIESKDLERKHK